MIKLIFFCILLSSIAYSNSTELNLSSEEQEFIKKNREIKVGIYSVEPYTFVEKGEVTGFTIDLLKKTAEKAGFDLKFKVYDSVTERIAGLRNNEIQILTLMLHSKEREKNFVFGKQYFEIKYSIFYNENASKINLFNDLNGKMIAIVKGHPLNLILKEQYPEVKIISVSSPSEALQLVEDGKVMATILDETVGKFKTGQMRLANIKIIRRGDFLSIQDRNAYGYVSDKKNKILISILDKAYNQIDRNEMLELLRDWSLGIPVSDSVSDKKIILTEQEREWIKDKKYLNVSSIDNFHPFSFIENGESKGYSIETMKMIGELLGKEIRFIQKPWSEQLEMLKRGEIDIVPHVAINERRKEFVTFTNFNHLTFLIAFVIKKDDEINSMNDLRGKKIAVVNRYYLHDYLMEKFPDLELLPVNSTGELVEAVAYGKAFAGIDNLPTLNYFIQKSWFNNLKNASVDDFGMELRTELPMGVQKGNYIMKSILEKANSALPEQEITRLKQKWLNTDLYSTVKKINLSQEEKKYLENKKEILMCIDPDWLPFEAFNDGEHIGMTADYFKIFEQSIGKPIKVINTNTWLESLDMAKEGKCDILSLAMHTSDREEYLDFTTPYFKTPLIIATHPHEPWISSLSALSEKKIGIVKGYAYAEILRREYPEINLVGVENISEGLTKVEEGEFFGFIGTLSAVGYQIQSDYFGLLKINGKFRKTWEGGIGVRKDEPLLKSIFDKAIENLTKEDHQLILNKWVNIKLEDDPTELTTKEKDFIKNHPIIRFKIRSDRPPFEFENNGKGSGIAVDYLKLISEKVGIRAEFVIDDSPNSEVFDMIEKSREKYDTVAFLVKSEERAERFEFGDTYLSYPMMIITNKQSPYIGKTSDLIGRKVAIEEQYLTNKWLKRDYPDIEIIPAKSTADALKMVNKGEAEAYVGNLAVANYMMIHSEMNNLKIQAPSDYGNINYSFVSPKEWPELATILSKGYKMINPNEHNIIQQSWFSVQMIESFDYTLFWRIFSVIGITLVFILYWNRRLSLEKRKTNKALSDLSETQEMLKIKYKELEELSITDKLTSLYNRAKLDEVLSTEFARSQRYSTVFGLILIDIDFFKKVNDTYGHQVGDSLLVEFSEILKSNFRKVDTVGRWGGEEFMIICPETDENGVLSLAEQIRKKISEAKFKDVGHKTASFGCSIYRNDNSIDKILKRTDEALYESKENGRNRVTLK